VEQALTKLLPPLIKETHYTYGWLKDNEVLAKTLREKFIIFADEILSSFDLDDYSATGSNLPTPEKFLLVHSRGKGLEFYLINVFLQYVGQKDVGAGDMYLMNVKRAADLRFPQEWFPMARQYQRTWYLHVGPTNSGKTYHALKRLEEVGDGIYAGPLRLLAHEIFERMNAKGIPCNLITGDDKRIVSQNAAVAASTVEMVDLSRQMEVAVLDEIQMIGDEERGWAWTQALLGVRAKEVHLCGEERTVDLIKNLAASVGDVVKIRHTIAWGHWK
jgi:ATP-dependent RNA helicase SUPV3L1/SUV3